MTEVVVTGGTGALGTAVVSALLARGDRCHVTWLFERELEGYAHRDTVELHQVDCASESEVAGFYASLPGVDASIHLVGGFAMADIAHTTLVDFESMFRLNAVTAFLCCREAIGRMTTAGGRIVNVAARPAELPTGGMVAYATAKSAVAALTRALAAEVTHDRILINAVLPSIMDSAANRRAMPKADFERWPKVEQVASTIAFLSGPDNTLTSGALVPVYGRA
jgi:NAD(P)-dependent dehydrogenase (short-subunit alcohol dehydrogenase family)